MARTNCRVSPMHHAVFHLIILSLLIAGGCSASLRDNTPGDDDDDVGDDDATVDDDVADDDDAADDDDTEDDDTEDDDDTGDDDTGADDDTADDDDSLAGTNLLANPGAESGDLSGWTVIDDGGDGWIVSSGGAHDGSYTFATSYRTCSKSQLLDLSALGFSSSFLDGQPEVQVEDWVKEIGYGEDEYHILVELRDASHGPLDIWIVDDVTPGHTNSCDYSDDVWFSEGHTFAGYGTGLRFIYFEHGGIDSEFWSGHYGPRFDDAAVIVGP